MVKIKSMIRRAVSVICMLSVCLGMFGTGVYADEQTSNEDDKNLAYVRVDEKGNIIQKNMKFMLDDIQNISVYKRKDDYCIILSRYLCFAFDNSFLQSNDGSDVFEFEIDYFDEGKGFMRLYYCNADYGSEYADYVEGTTFMENTKTWKTAKRTVDDANFNRKMWGRWDGRLMAEDWISAGYTSQGSVPIKEIRVRKIPQKNKIKIFAETEEKGNVFDWFADSKKIKHTYKNRTSETVSCNLNYKVTAQQTGKTWLEKNETLTFLPNEEKVIEFDVGEIKNCDIYDLNVHLESDDKTISEDKKSMVFAIVKSDPNGMSDDFMYTCASMGLMFESEFDVACALLKKAGFRGLRSSVSWDALERKKGVYMDESADYWHNTMKKYGLKNLMGLGVNNRLYMTPEEAALGEYALPQGETEMEGWRNYVKEAVKRYKDIADIFYLWNEPANAIMDRRGYNNPQMYADVMKETYIAAKSVDKNVIVTGTEDTDLWNNSNNSGGGHLRSVITDTDFLNYADALSVHPYLPYANYNLDKKDYPEQVLSGDTPMHTLKELAKEKTGKDIDIWTTEGGYTYSKENGSIYNTSYEQGAYNVRAAVLLRRSGTVKNFAIYCIADSGTGNGAEDCFGMLRAYRLSAHTYYGKIETPHEAYLALAAHNYLMAKTTSTGVFDLDENTKISEFYSDKFKSSIAVLNTAKGVENVSVDVGAKSIELYDLYGNVTTLHSESGVYDISCSYIPKYIKGDFKKFEVKKGEPALFGFEGVTANKMQYDTCKITINKFDDSDYTINIGNLDGAEVKSNNGFVGNKAEVELYITAQPGNSINGSIEIVDGSGNIAGIGDISIDVLTPLTVKNNLSVSLNNPNNTSVWSGNIQIQNNHESEPLKGYVEFKSPDLFKKLGKIDLGIIPSGQTGNVSFNIPGVHEKGIYSVGYDIVDESGRKFEETANIDMTLASYAAKKPVIDGVADKDEWNKSNAMYLDSIENVSWIDSQKSWGGKNDLSAEATVMWDEDNYYMMVQVKDDVFCQPYSKDEMWKGDSVQIGVYYGKDGFKYFGSANSFFAELCMALTPDGPMVYKHKSQQESDKVGLVENCELAVKREGTVTTYEFKIPWTELLENDDPIINGNKIGFSMLVNDNDATTGATFGRRGWIQYADGIGGAKNRDLFTYMYLIGGADK